MPSKVCESRNSHKYVHFLEVMPTGVKKNRTRLKFRVCVCALIAYTYQDFILLYLGIFLIDLLLHLILSLEIKKQEYKQMERE